MRRGGWSGAPIGLVLGTGCLLPNPNYDSPPEASDSQGRGGSSTGTASGGTSGAAPTTGAAGTGAGGGSSGGSSGGSPGGSIGITSASSGGSSSGSGGSTGEGGSSTGAQSSFCAPDLQAANQCVPLATTGDLVCDAQVTWQAAADACAAMCGRLAVILNDADRMAVYMALRDRMTQAEKDLEVQIEMGGDQISQPLASLWVGAKDTDANAGGPFMWLDGTLDPAVAGQGGWEPNGADEAGGSCMVMALWGKGVADGMWCDRTCTLTYRFVCDPG